MPLSKQSMTIPFLTAIEKTMTAKTKTAKTKALRANLLLSKLPAIELDIDQWAICLGGANQPASQQCIAAIHGESPG
jgi:hypothetical protein